jgi:dynein heavy chain
MPQLEAICSGLVDSAAELHEDFRLILTSMPVDFFPTSILQNGLKMTTEPPRGIKSNLQRSYQSIVTQETYDEMNPKYDGGARSSLLASEREDASQHNSKGPGALQSIDTSGYLSAANSNKAGARQAREDQSVTPGSELAGLREKQMAYRNLLYGLCFFHAVIQERRKFGPLGWNIFYEYTDADLRTSITMLKNFLDDNDEIPWEALRFMTGHINYGGNVTDDFDRILLMSFLNIFQSEEVVDKPGYAFSKSGTYICPVHEKASEAREHIATLPNQDDPEVFGMNNNANIAYLTGESEKILQTVLHVQPRSSAGGQGGAADDSLIIDLITKIQGEIPEPIGKDFAKDIMKLNAQGLLHCLTTVLLQEVQRYNRLLDRITTSLQQLHNAVLGVVLSSPTLDAMHTSLLDNHVPAYWTEVAYPSLKPLSSWITDLVQRIDFMREWAQKGHPSSYWLAGFFFPHGFMTGVLQTYARRHNKPIDLLQFEFEVLSAQDASAIAHGPSDGIYVYALFLECAKWDPETRVLVEATPGEMHSQMPVIHFNPKYHAPEVNKEGESPTKMKRAVEEPEDEVEVYKCPVYKTSARAGTLNTTGRSDNFILTIDLPCGVPETQEDRIKKTYGTEFDDEGEPGAAVPFASPEFWTLRGTALLSMLNV